MVRVTSASHSRHGVSRGNQKAAKKKEEEKQSQLRKVAAWDLHSPESLKLKQYAPRSLFLFRLDNTFRQRIIGLVESKPFDWLILACILANCVFLMLFDPTDVDPNSPRNTLLQRAELFFACLFIGEAVLKTISYGFIMDRRAYLRNGWNRMDFLIVLTSITVFYPNLEGNYSFFRALRVFRPLRTLTHIESLRVLVNSLLLSLPLLADVGILTSMFFFVFVTLGIELFSGAFHNRCYDPPSSGSGGAIAGVASVPDGYSLVDAPFGNPCGVDLGTLRCPAQQVCLDDPSNLNYLNNGVNNFDHFGWGFLTAFQAITQEGWSEVMYELQDTAGWPAVPFFVLLVLIGAFFLLNLALAVISETFSNEQSHEAEDEKKLLEKQKKDGKSPYRALRVLKQTGNKMTQCFGRCFSLMGRFRMPRWIVKPCHVLVESKLFTGTIITLIVFNLVVLAVEYYGVVPMPPSYVEFLNTANLVLTFAFVLELILKVTGLGVAEYWKSSFNRFDAAIVAISLLELGMSGNSAFTVLRGARVLRILKLVRQWRTLRRLLTIIVRSMSALGAFVVFLMLFLLIYAILGMQIFGNTPARPVPRSNFETLGNAFVSVFVVLSGENWNSIMYDFIAVTDSWFTSIYFVSLVVMGSFILFNLFLAILLQNFALQQREEWKKRAIARAKKPARSVAKKLRKHVRRGSTMLRSTSLVSTTRRLRSATLTGFGRPSSRGGGSVPPPAEGSGNRFSVFTHNRTSSNLMPAKHGHGRTGIENAMSQTKELPSGNPSATTLVDSEKKNAIARASSGRNRVIQECGAANTGNRS